MADRRLTAFALAPSSRAAWNICVLLVATVTSGWCQDTNVPVARPIPATISYTDDGTAAPVVIPIAASPNGIAKVSRPGVTPAAVQFYTTSPHLLSLRSSIIVTGASNATFNTRYTVYFIENSTHFNATTTDAATIGLPYLARSGGGTVTTGFPPTSDSAQDPAGNLPQAINFTIVHHLGNAPDLSPYGIQPLASIWQTRLFPSCTDDTPYDTPRLKMELDRVDKSPIPTMLDVECGNLWSDADYSKNLSRLRNVLAAVRQARPDMQFGFFGIIPPTSWRWTSFNLNDLAFRQRWKKVNQKAQSDFVPYVDALFLDLYTIVPNSAVWEGYARMVLETARQFHKPVYCVLWPQYYDLDQHGERGPYLERSYWRLELDTCYRYADGIVLYDEPRGKKWDPSAPWWQETLSFQQTLH